LLLSIFSSLLTKVAVTEEGGNSMVLPKIICSGLLFTLLLPQPTVYAEERVARLNVVGSVVNEGMQGIWMQYPVSNAQPYKLGMPNPNSMSPLPPPKASNTEIEKRTFTVYTKKEVDDLFNTRDAKDGNRDANLKELSTIIDALTKRVNELENEIQR